MLLACTFCKRQYDIRDHRPGTELACGCGVTLVVPKATKRNVRMQHCSSCGAGLAPDSKFCSFCGAGVSLAERGLGPSCSQCLTRLPKDAAFCPSCGIDVNVQPVRRALSTSDCPRCKSSLTEVTATGESPQDVHFSECESCGGVWLDEPTVERLVKKTEAGRPPLPPSAGLRSGDKSSGSDVRPVETISYIPCPVCHQLMNRTNFGRVSGIVLDRCRGHGYWFDHEELQGVLDFVDRGGLDRTREREKQDLEMKARQTERQENSIRSADRRSRGRRNNSGWWGWDVLDLGGRFFTDF
ncbi:MAG: zf-TFIIB domain-containing protein [Planctomycetota bacterium]